MMAMMMSLVLPWCHTFRHYIMFSPRLYSESSAAHWAKDEHDEHAADDGQSRGRASSARDECHEPHGGNDGRLVLPFACAACCLVIADLNEACTPCWLIGCFERRWFSWALRYGKYAWQRHGGHACSRSREGDPNQNGNLWPCRVKFSERK